MTAVIDTQGLPAVATLVAESGHTTVTSHRKTVAAKVHPQKVRLKLKHVHLHPQDTLQLVVTDAGGTTKESFPIVHH